MSNPIDLQQELLTLVRAQRIDLAGRSNVPALEIGRSAAEVNPAAPANPENGGSDAVSQLSRELEALRRQLGVAEETAKRQVETLDQNTRAVLEGNTRSGTGVASLARDAASTVRNTGTLGALSSPLAGLVNWLFRRGSITADEPALTPVTPPPAIDASFGISSAGAPAPITYGVDRVPRITPSATRPSAAAHITIQVQAMDSRSFLDNSDQIARAVREAMLNSHSLNDVIGEM